MSVLCKMDRRWEAVADLQDGATKIGNLRVVLIILIIYMLPNLPTSQYLAILFSFSAKF